MANVKQVYVDGITPFHLHEHEPLQPMLAFLSGPTSGLSIQYSQHGYRDNEHGGKTAFYNFTLLGHEAVSWGWIDKFKAEITAIGGEIREDKTKDIEDGQ